LLLSDLALYSVRVQFGADGPFRTYTSRGLRHATLTEVHEQHLEGVGGLTIVVTERKASGLTIVTRKQEQEGAVNV
jgi:hypothetical protein